MTPDISVLLPARDDGARVAATIAAMAAARTAGSRIEFVVADDLSDTPVAGALHAAAFDRLAAVTVRTSRLNARAGRTAALDHAAALATGDLLFLTDAHARFAPGWDAVLRNRVGDDVVAGVVAQANTPFRAWGARLHAPAMTLRWNTAPQAAAHAVEIAPAAATALRRATFDRIGGFDPGFVAGGAAEPEFSVRAWLLGHEVRVEPGLEVTLGFRPRAAREAATAVARVDALHNALRFGLLYFGEAGGMQLLRYHACHAPDDFHAAIRAVATSDLWQRRREREAVQVRDFAWFADRFDLRDPLGGAVW